MPTEREIDIAFTEADFNSWRFNHDAVHFNGGKVFFGYGHRCVDQPRLLVIDKYFKADRSTKRSYLIDDKTPCETLDEALALLSKLPVLSAEELELLRSMPDGKFKPESRAPYLPLVAMGFAKFEKEPTGFFLRRTENASAALEAAEKVK